MAGRRCVMDPMSASSRDGACGPLSTDPEKFQKEGRPIPQRPSHAVAEVGDRTGEEIYLALRKRISGGIIVDGTFDFIDEWYKRRYGNRLNVNWSPGDGVILIRGDAYRFGIPRVFGTVKFICRPQEIGVNRSKIGVSGEPPTCNMLDQIEGLTKPYALSLRPEEINNIWENCRVIMQYYGDIEASLKCINDNNVKRLVGEALDDLRNSAEHVIETIVMVRHDGTLFRQ